ncbi:MAG: hypothetical protein H7249_09300 [Chitinophagaceae bacterium]|nr:hypothetical protein [Oligoflexus sp.]
MLIKALGLFLLVMFAVSCTTVLLQDGKIPDDEQKKVAVFLGEYKGSLKLETANTKVDEDLHTQVVFNLKEVGGTLVLESSSSLIGEGCDVSVGKLRELRLSESSLHARFTISSQKCADRIRADTILVLIDDKQNGAGQMTTFIGKDYANGRSHRKGKALINIVGHLEKVADPLR